MQFQAFNKILIGDQKLMPYQVAGVTMGYEFQIRYPSYRGTFLSCIEKLDVYMDGKQVDPRSMYFKLNGKEYTMDEIKDQYKAYWYVLDFATITVICDEELSKGPHDLTIDMYHRIPYAGYDGGYLGLPSKVTKTLVYEGGR